MNCYFYSEHPSYLKINGEYVGVISKNVTFINANENAFYEFIPVNNDLFPLSCLNLKCDDLYVFKVPNGNLYVPRFNKKRNLPYSIVFQRNFSEMNVSCQLTVVTDGSVKFYLDGDVTATDELPFIPNSSDVLIKNGFVAVSFVKEKTALFIYDLVSKNLCYKNVVDKFEFTDTLSVTEYKSDFYPITVVSRWELAVPFKAISVASNVQDGIPTVMLPYVFCELVKAKASVSFLLSQSLSERETELIEFIGGIGSIIPPIDGEENETLCLRNGILKKLKFSISSGKIDNVFIDD